MERNFLDALKHRRTIYGLSNDIQVTVDELKQLIESALLNVPSAFNSQTTRIVLLLSSNHKEFWEITKAVLKEIAPAASFSKTEEKINTSFAAGYGTILFYEDMEAVEGMQKSFPTYSERFPVWSEHTSAMHQLTIWTMLEDKGLGASLQHYNPIIDERVAKRWGINPKWKLIAQMPFGKPTVEPGEKSREPIEKRFLIFD